MEIRCQIIFIKPRFWKIHELETFGTRKRILRTKLEGCSCDRKRPVVFWIFHTFPCIFSRELFLVAAHGSFAIQTNVWKVPGGARCSLCAETCKTPRKSFLRRLSVLLFSELWPFDNSRRFFKIFFFLRCFKVRSRSVPARLECFALWCCSY